MDIRTILIRFALAMATPLKLRATRSAWIERHLELPLTDDDHRQIAKALVRDGVSLGHYYHWYLEKHLVAKVLRNATRERVLRLAEAADKTDYTELDRLFDERSGLVLAIPHVGNYILAIVRLFARYGRSRDIAVFYASPEKSTGNAVFDFIYTLCFKNDPATRTRVLHANRAGLADAMKLLRSGGVLLMLPDVSLNPDDAYMVPFLGRTFDAMLGSASFARRTNSRLVPCMATQTGNLAFELRSAHPIASPASLQESNSQYRDLAIDYAATAAMFAAFETWMAGQNYRWQPIREHFAKTAPYQTLDIESLEKLWPAFLADPRVKPSDPSTVLDIGLPKSESLAPA